MANQPTKYRKFIVGAASAALVASAVAPVAMAASFTDVKDNNSHKEAIDALSDAGVITGYQDGTFKPNKTLTRSDVVKLMGKWLISEGYDVPTNYKTKPRFADLKTTSNDELLKMSAIVFDNGVFNGTADGKLDPNSDITRENMAIVIVRAFDRVHDIDLASYVKDQDFKKDVTDLGKAKAEARPAIDVLDFFDITNPAAPEFNPKSTTTRGQFASFLYKTTKADFSKVDGGIVAPGVATVKAINATTVEVTMKDKVSNIDSLKFTIDGLTVSNAAVKHTDDKTVVLTTAVQKGGEKYTVMLDGKAIGSFTGVETVVPTSIKITNQSVQGKTGQQVILSADTGVKKAGIPVTFNVKAPTTSTTNKDQVYEVMTNEDGIATFSYTQYSAGRDEVTVYPTGAPTVRDTGYVFWGVDTILMVEDVTAGSTIMNNANKTYKVTHRDAVTGKPVANKTLNVSFKENIEVTPDKLKDATVNGVKVSQLTNGTEVTAAQITTDSKGEATFTVSGKNTSVTPVVFDANNVQNTNGTWAYDYKYDASDLQAMASTVTFSATQMDYTLELARDNGEVAATGAANGRKYTVTVKNKEGNIAANEIVNVAFNEDLDRVISTNTKAKFVKVNTDGSQQYFPVSGDKKVDSAKQISVKTDSKGQASFVIGSDDVNDYATPIAWIDVNNANAVEGQLDEGEPKVIGQISYFQNAYLDGAGLKVYNEAGKEVEEVKANENATFQASLVNQSGKTVKGTEVKKVSYTVFNTGANDVSVDLKQVDSEGKAMTQIVSPNRSYTVSFDAKYNAKGEWIPSSTALEVTPTQDKNTSVRVLATGIAKDLDSKDYAFTSKEATVSFTATKEVSNLYTGLVDTVDTDKKELTFENKEAVKYAGEKDVTYAYKGVGNTPIATAEDFITEVLKNSTTITREVKGNTVTFYIIEQGSGKKPVDVADGLTILNDSIKAGEAVKGTDYTAASYKVLTDAVTAAKSLASNATDVQRRAAAKAIDDAITGLVPVTIESVKVTGAVATATGSIADRIVLTFDKSVNEDKIDFTKFNLTPVGGTIAGVVPDGNKNDNKVTFSVTGATGLDLGTLTFPEVKGLAVDGGDLKAGTISITAAEGEVVTKVTDVNANAVTEVVAGTSYNVILDINDLKAKFNGTTESSVVKLEVSGKESITLAYRASQQKFDKLNVQGYTESELKNAVVTVN